MTTLTKHYVTVAALTWFGIVGLLNTAGCTQDGIDGEVVLRPNRDVAALSADDIVRVMQRAGFADDQIIHLCTDLRNSLSSTGAAHIVIDGKVEAIFAVEGERLYIASRLRGSFIYNLAQDTFTEPPRSSRAGRSGPPAKPAPKLQ